MLLYSPCCVFCPSDKFYFPPERGNCSNDGVLWFLWMFSFVSWTWHPLLSAPNPWLRPHGHSSLTSQPERGHIHKLSRGYLIFTVCSLLCNIKICSTIKTQETEPGKTRNVDYFLVICDWLYNYILLELNCGWYFHHSLHKTTLSMCAQITCAIMVALLTPESCDSG